MLTQAMRDAWVAALRDPDALQLTPWNCVESSSLAGLVAARDNPVGNCCLGVLAKAATGCTDDDLAGHDTLEELAEAGSSELRRAADDLAADLHDYALNLHGRDKVRGTDVFMALNDREGWSFGRIANYVEHLPVRDGMLRGFGPC